MITFGTHALSGMHPESLGAADLSRRYLDERHSPLQFDIANLTSIRGRELSTGSTIVSVITSGNQNSTPWPKQEGFERSLLKILQSMSTPATEP